MNNKKAEASASELKKINNDGYTKNETLGRVGGKKSQKIKDFFVSHPDEEFTPKQIAFFCGLPHNTVKVTCWRLWNKGFLIQPLQNHYAYKQIITATELQNLQKTQDLRFHNFRLSIPRKSGYTFDSTPSAVTLPVTQSTFTTSENKQSLSGEFPEVTPAKPFYTDKQQRIKKADNFSIDTTGIKAYYYTYKIVMYVICSENPLDVPEFNHVIGVIEGRGYDLSKADITDIEVNIDVPDLHIYGTNCIELRTFTKAIQRMYNKSSRLREEIIIRGARIPLEEGIAALRGKQALGTNALYLETEALNKEVHTLKENLKENNRVVGVLANMVWQLADKKGGSAT